MKKQRKGQPKGQPKGQHGGVRTPGPGKRLGRPPKPDKKVNHTICVTPDVRVYLRHLGSVEVEDWVRRSKSFREWHKAWTAQEAAFRELSREAEDMDLLN